MIEKNHYYKKENDIISIVVDNNKISLTIINVYDASTNAIIDRLEYITLFYNIINKHNTFYCQLDLLYN